jgi:hypothetical protein
LLANTQRAAKTLRAADPLPPHVAGQPLDAQAHVELARYVHPSRLAAAPTLPGRRHPARWLLAATAAATLAAAIILAPDQSPPAEAIQEINAPFEGDAGDGGQSLTQTEEDGVISRTEGAG